MKPPLPLPYGENTWNNRPPTVDASADRHQPSVAFCVLAILCSALLIFGAVGDVGTTYGPSCCKGPLLVFVTAPFVVPFVSLLWAKKLTLLGLVARGAVTSALVVGILGLGLCAKWMF